MRIQPLTMTLYQWKLSHRNSMHASFEEFHFVCQEWCVLYSKLSCTDTYLNRIYLNSTIIYVRRLEVVIYFYPIVYSVWICLMIQHVSAQKSKSVRGMHCPRYYDVGHIAKYFLLAGIQTYKFFGSGQSSQERIPAHSTGV